ncbi:LOW QUALITY PROTEIN: retinol-binding protein 3 [Anableps anableps]
MALLKAYINRVFKVEVLLGNTGYLRFDELAETSAVPELEELMAQKVWEPLKDTDNLIIDLRHNTRGSSNSLTLILSYLCDCSQKQNFFTINDQIQNTTEHKSLSKIIGPVYNSKHGVYVLTSYHTASIREELAYLIQSLSCGTVVGEIISGNLMHSKTFQIEGTDTAITVPFINFIDNDGEYWLGGGVVPDAIVLAEEALDHVYEIMAFHKGLRTLIAGVGEVLEKHYSIQEVARKVSQVLLTKWAEGLYRPVVDFESLASQLTADIHDSSGDHRIYVFHYCESESPHDIPKMSSSEEFGYITESLFKIKVLPGNIGYLCFDMMLDIEMVKAIGPQLLNSVWKKIVNTDALIIDMRYNTGGYSTAVPLFCTYFFDAEPVQHFYTIYDCATNTLTKVMTFSHIRGPQYGSSKELFILTSHMTGSPPELFARSMSDLNRATIIGEPVGPIR